MDLLMVFGRFPPAAPPPPTCRTGPDSEATVQALQPVQPLGPQLCRTKRGSALGTAYILAHSVLLQKKALVSGGHILKS